MILPVKTRLSKSLIISMCVHAAVLSIPVSMVVRHGTQPIEVSLIADHSPPPKEETRKPEPPRKPAPPKRKPEPPKPMRLEEKAPPPRPEEAKDVKPQVVSPGEQTVMSVAPGAGDAETGVAIAGARVGTGGTAIGGSMPGGTGSGTGYGFGGGRGQGKGTGPVDTQFGRGDGPRFAYRAMPEYPFAAKRLGKEGRVVLEVVIDEEGGLEKVEVIEATDQMFVEPAVDSIRKSKFLPAKKDGVPFKARCKMLIRFGFG